MQNPSWLGTLRAPQGRLKVARHFKCRGKAPSSLASALPKARAQAVGRSAIKKNRAVANGRNPDIISAGFNSLRGPALVLVPQVRAVLFGANLGIMSGADGRRSKPRFYLSALAVFDPCNPRSSAVSRSLGGLGALSGEIVTSPVRDC
ncbi:MAG: hypothetical protein L0Z53_23450 [Acidobacteriales bacterium]|nr:hypothetical protein [Terriglobales bacterium]